MAGTPSSAVFDILEHTIPASHIREYPRATATSQDDPLLLHVKQYVPKSAGASPPQKGHVTIIGAHGNGFVKELYEPLWEDVYRELQAKGIGIRSIIVADYAWQGRSGILNRKTLGNDPSWHDAVRDVAQVINTLRPPRPLLAVGHSMGSLILLSAALAHPRLFASTVLIEPVFYDLAHCDLATGRASLRRRESWPSRAAARLAFLKNPYFASWDPRVLDRQLRHGLVDAPDGAVALATSKHQELVTYVRPVWPAFDAAGTALVRRRMLPDTLFPAGFSARATPFYRPEVVSILSRAPALRPGALYIQGSRSEIPNTQIVNAMVARTGDGEGGSGGVADGRVRTYLVEGGGHAVPLQDPGQCAAQVALWWADELQRWRKEEGEFEEWARVTPAAEKALTTVEFRKRLGGMTRSTKQAKL